LPLQWPTPLAVPLCQPLLRDAAALTTLAAPLRQPLLRAKNPN